MTNSGSGLSLVELCNLIEDYEVRLCQGPPKDRSRPMGASIELRADGTGNIVIEWFTPRDGVAEGLWIHQASEYETDHTRVSFNGIHELIAILDPERNRHAQQRRTEEGHGGEDGQGHRGGSEVSGEAPDTSG